MKNGEILLKMRQRQRRRLGGKRLESWSLSQRPALSSFIRVLLREKSGMERGKLSK